MDTTADNTKLSRESGLLLASLIILGFLGNVFKLHLFFNVDFLFGSIFAILVIYLYGPLWGVLAAAIIASYTYVLWQHPYAIVIALFEALFVGALYNRRSNNVVLLDTVYWLIMGAPLVFLFYYVVMGVGIQATTMLSVKQTLNGVFNALVASLVVSALNYFFPMIGVLKDSHSFSFRHVLFNTMVAVVMVPALIIMVVSARTEMARIEETITENLEVTTYSAERTLNAWVDSNMQHMRALAAFAGFRSIENVELLQTEVELLTEADLDFRAVGVTDAEGRVIAVQPPYSENRVISIGADLHDVRFFKRLHKHKLPVVSEVFQSGKGFGTPLVAMSTPIMRDGGMAGAAFGVLDLNRIGETLRMLITERNVEATVVDEFNNIVVSSYPHVMPGSAYDAQFPGHITHLPSGIYVRVPELEGAVAAVERWQRSVYAITERLESSSGWQLVLHAPTAPHQDSLNRRFLLIMAVVLVVVTSTIALSSLLSRTMVSSLAKLNQVTTNLPERIGDDVGWPRSSIQEVESLIRNFRNTARKLAHNIQQLTLANEELVRAKIEADAANRAKSQFIANVSHDLRTPLNGILGYAQILRHDSDLADRHRGAIDVIERSGNHLLNLINDILDVSKIEAGKMRLSYSSFSLRGLLKDLTNVIEVQANERGLEFQAIIDPIVPEHAYGDELRLRQILLNLLNNAVKFTPEGSVTLEVRRLGDDTEFEVRDTGIGIPDDQLEEIFSPFKQIDKHVHVEEGTGLGLAIVERLVDMMDGVLKVRSTVGEGSSFTVRISLPIGEPEANPRSLRPGVRGFKGDERTVLVIDDKWENRSVLTNMLEAIGFRVLEAPDGHEGIETALQSAPDLILMDLVMPVMDGFDAIKVIRNTAALSRCPVIAISASVAEPIRQECKRLGFDDFLAKPFQECDLLDMLATYLGITWIYEAGETEPVGAGPGREKRRQSIPSAEALRELQRHVRRGDIKGIIETVDKLRKNDSCYGDFCDHVAHLAKGFQIDKLAEYVADVVRKTE